MKNVGIKLLDEIQKKYAYYHVKQIIWNRFTHAFFHKILKQFKSSSKLKFSTLGFSYENRIIEQISFGNGKTKVLLWSQMHGNESTATRAILDILNFLIADDEFNDFREEIAKNLTLSFIPMLNPDGTNRFQRRAANEIDINRDAVVLQTIEGKLLMNIVDQFKPDFAFNLHDQRRFYNVKNTEIPSSMSFLAPAYNESREVNGTRKKAMQIIAGMNDALQNYIAKGVGLYDDAYSLRSFGDKIQKKGVSTILIESGWLPNDMEKEGIRKLNFVALLSAFQMIVKNNFSKFSVKDYFNIPSIDTKLFDLLIKNVSIDNDASIKVDFGINRTEYLLKAPNYYSVGVIEDVGDLSLHYGFKTINTKGLRVIAGKSILIDNPKDISLVSVKRFLRKGILFIIIKNIPFTSYVPFPINLVHPQKMNKAKAINFGGKANFLLVNKVKKIKYIVLNGYILNPSRIDARANGLVLV